MSHTTVLADQPEVAPRPKLAGYRRVADTAFAGIAALFVLGVLAQVFLAGLGAFHGSAGFGPHETLGNILSIVGEVMLLVALIARASWRTVVGTLLLAVLAEVAQHALASFGWDHPWLGAAHALDGMVILLLGVGLAVTSFRRVRRYSSQ